ncbi:MAG TPA: PAS domain S-box protein [Terriglobales bacterium]|nr:PAS domain S-box protein [Terriglobales bacterium]
MKKKERKKIAGLASIRRLREALRQSEAHRKALLDSAFDCIICTDGEGRIIEFNAAAERTFRRSRSGVVGADLAETILPVPLRDFHRREFFHSPSAGKSEMIGSRLESTAIRSDGVEFPAEFTVSKVIAGERTMFTVNVRDISARLRAEESTLRLAAIVESSQDAIYGSDAEGRLRSWNKGAELTYGYTAEEVLEKNVSILTPPGLEEELAKISERVREGQQSRNIETVRMAKGGRLLHVSLTVSPILDGHGEVIGASAIARDITARKAAEEALRRATETSVYASPVPIIGVDTAGRVTLWNPAAEQVFGWSEQELVGRPNPVIPDDEADITSLLYKRLLAGETVRGVELHRRKRDGSLVPVSLSAAPLWDEGGNVKGIIKFLTDITGQKRIEEALRAAEEKYRSIFVNSLEGIYQVTPDGRYLSANPALARMLGFDSAEDLMRTRQDIANQEYVDPAQRTEFVRLLEDQGLVQNFEYQVYRKDGKIILVSENARVIRDAQGNILYYEGTVQDITQERQLEQLLRQVQKVEAVGRLAGGVAHDFNNILMAVSSFAELIGRKIAGDSAAASYVEEILKASDRGSALTRSLLAFSRKQVFLPKVVDLNSLIQDQLGMLRRLIPANIELKFVPGAGLGAVKIDPSQMEQVVMNLVINARDAMPEGGHLLIETSSERAGLQQNGLRIATQECVVLAVRDSGIGMDAATQAHIFEPFFTTKEQGKGTGLGLATVFGIVQQSGGDISVQSEPGAGSTFRIYLPRVQAEAVASENTDEAAAFYGGSETILLAEDEPNVRESAATYLRENGYTVLVAANGSEALQLAERHSGPIHLLLTDLVMPGMKGSELAQQIQFSWPEIRVVFMSGYSSDLFSGREKLDPAHMFLQKPFRLTALGRCIRDVLNRKAAAGAG